jgi:hypothetical protein
VKKLVFALLLLPAVAVAQVHPSLVHPENDYVFGAMYQDDPAGAGGTDITVTSSGVFYVWSTADDSLVDGFTFDGTACTFTAMVSGIYYVSSAVSFSGNNNAVVTCSVHLNNARYTRITFNRKLGATDVGNAAMQGIITLAVGDAIDLRCTSDADATEINIWHASLTAGRLGNR